MQFHWTYKMVQVKELKIKNQTYYFLDDMIDIKNFNSNLLKIDKKSHKDIGIYYIGYITIKKFSDCKNVHSVNPLYLIIHCATGHFKEKYGEKYWIIDSTVEYEEFFSGIRSEIKMINGGKELFYEKNYARIGISTDDDLPINNPLKFPALTIIIWFVLQEGEYKNYNWIINKSVASTNLFRWVFLWVSTNARIRQNRHFRRNGH